MELTANDLQWAKDAIRKTEIFSACTDGELDELAGGLEKQHYNQGSTILFQGEISSKLCLVESGTVAVVVRAGKDKNKVAELGPGSYFGEISLLMPRAATATIKAEAEADIIFLPGEVVQALVNKNPALSEALSQKIAERLEAQKKKPEQK